LSSSEQVPGSVVTVEVVDRVATITFDRPARLNAFTHAMREQYLDALKDLDRDSVVDAIVVTGAGRGFSAGADFAVLDGIDADELRRQETERTLDVVMQLSTPLIAAINGPAAGIGLVHALLADVRIASESATFTTAFVRLGLVAEAGIGWLLPRLVGTGAALDLLFSSRTIKADEALRIGLVQRVVPAERLRAQAQTYAVGLSSGSSGWALAQIRRQVYDGWSQDWDSAYARSRELAYRSLARPEFNDRVSRQTKKRSGAS
jgi:enoyl-CoA hydratase/carnithine racemase